jgi:hypothetical protein
MVLPLSDLLLPPLCRGGLAAILLLPHPLKRLKNSLPFEGFIITHKWRENGRVKVIIKQLHDLIPPTLTFSPEGRGDNIEHIH